MKLKEVLTKSTQFFSDKGLETPRLDAELLLSHALKLNNRMDLYLKFDQPVSEKELADCRELVRRRSLHEPVAYILGYKDFYRSRFQVSPAVLIPRPETEIMVERASEWLKKKNLQNPQGLDLGTGSGCIAGSLLLENPELKMQVVDISEEAMKIAKRNFQSLEIADRVDALVLDVQSCSFATEHFDIILANPPYISMNDSEVHPEVKKFEPKTALFSEKEGLADLYSWSDKAALWLKSPGLLIFEMGYTQGPKFKQHLLDLQKFDNVEIIEDLSGKQRFLLAEKY